MNPLLRRGCLRLSAKRSPGVSFPLVGPRLLSTLILRPNSPKPLDTRWRGLRWNSTVPAAAAAAAPTPPAVTETAASSIDALADSMAPVISAIPPIQSGDFAALGLCHWTPVGLIQYSFETINVLTGMPWFYTIIAGAVFWRLAIWPLSVVGARHAALMRPAQPKISEAVERMKKARDMSDTVGMQRASMDMAKARKESGASMLMMMLPTLQLPISIGMFFAVRRMCELPVMQLTQSGFDWLPDLTVPDPTYIIPVALIVSGNIMLQLSVRDMDASNTSMGHLMNLIRVLTVGAFFWMINFPAGLSLALLVTSVVSAAQILALRVPAVRRAFNIPALTGPAFRMPTLRETVRYYLSLPQQSGLKKKGFMTTPKIAPYVPPTATSTPKQPKTLEELARQAQANAGPSSLFETPEPKPARKPASTTKKATQARQKNKK
ncbi:Inner membrane protein [Mycena chlorophos]|uniref:Inner membrane protein n=1 Tax=Mycena chlorophos TaxID=658473 RepID=A0A8H6WL49_MYCCL|nr:Inner membrane protein [Mycena chlorophos]